MPPPYTSVTHVRSITGIQASERQDRDIGMAIEWSWRELRRKSGQTFDGLIDKEFIAVSDGVRYKYRLKFFPVLDAVEEAGGATTNDTSEITIYTVDTATPETYTALATTDYLLHGDEGLIIFKSNKIPNIGLEIYVSYKHDPHIIRHCETLLAAYYVFDSMANSKDKAMEYMTRFENDYKTHLMTVLDDRV